MRVNLMDFNLQEVFWNQSLPFRFYKREDDLNQLKAIHRIQQRPANPMTVPPNQLANFLMQEIYDDIQSLPTKRWTKHGWNRRKRFSKRHVFCFKITINKQCPDGY